jgi:hypothetical protein
MYHIGNKNCFRGVLETMGLDKAKNYSPSITWHVKMTGGKLQLNDPMMTIHSFYRSSADEYRNYETSGMV